MDIYIDDFNGSSIDNDAGIYCSCDDYKVHPQDNKELRASAFNIASTLLLLLTIITLAGNERD